MSIILQFVGFIGAMIAGTMADSENLTAFFAVMFVSMVLMATGIYLEGKESRRRRRKKRSGKFNYYFR